MKNEKQIELSFIEKLKELKYIYREDIKDKASLEENFRKHFQELNKVRLSDSEFARLKESIITPDVFSAAKILRETNTFERDDDTPLQYTLVNTNDWFKNEYEVINQLRINTENSHHRYDVIILINGIPVVQVELKSLQITPKRAMEQIVDYKNDPGNGYTNSLLCFMQLFIVSNESNTYYFANNNKEHFAFDADERFLPVHQFADKDNKKITHLHDFSEAVLRKCALGELISKYMVLVGNNGFKLANIGIKILCIFLNFKLTFLIITSQFLFYCLFIIIGQVAQKEKRQHIISKIIGVHCATQFISNRP